MKCWTLFITCWEESHNSDWVSQATGSHIVFTVKRTLLSEAIYTHSSMHVLYNKTNRLAVQAACSTSWATETPLYSHGPISFALHFSQPTHVIATSYSSTTDPEPFISLKSNSQRRVNCCSAILLWFQYFLCVQISHQGSLQTSGLSPTAFTSAAVSECNAAPAVLPAFPCSISIASWFLFYPPDTWSRLCKSHSVPLSPWS